MWLNFKKTNLQEVNEDRWFALNIIIKVDSSKEYTEFVYFKICLPPSMKGSNSPVTNPKIWKVGTGQQIILEECGLPKKWISK